MDKEIRDVFYNVSSPACYAGAAAVYRECKRRKINVTKKQVDNYLAKQEAYTRHKPAVRRFRRNVIKTYGFDVDWQCDLADMHQLKTANDGFCYVAVFIDVLSRFAFAKPIKKKKPELVAKALDEIVAKTGRMPWRLTTDRGNEYKGSEFQKYLRKHDIQHRYATSPDVKCAIAERFIRTLKSRIWKHFTRHHTQRYIDILPSLVDAINNSYNRTIKCAPVEVTRDNEVEIRERLYGKPRKVARFLYKTGDKVRIQIEKHKLSKGYWPNFSSEIFVISRALKNRFPATYKLKDLSAEELDGVFYSEELVRVGDTEKPIREIETLVKSQKRDGELWHLVKWKKKKGTTWIHNDELVSI